MGINPWDCKPMGATRRSLRAGKLAWGQVDSGRAGCARDMMGTAECSSLPKPYPGTIEESILRGLPSQVTELKFFDDRLEGEVVREIPYRGTWAEKL